MFAPWERAFPHRLTQRLFRTEWREDLFYYLVSTMFVQILGFLALAPSTIINDHTSNWEAFRAAVASLPWIVQFVVVLVARSEEHTSELQSLMRISYAVFCLKKKNYMTITH